MISLTGAKEEAKTLMKRARVSELTAEMRVEAMEATLPKVASILM